MTRLKGPLVAGGRPMEKAVGMPRSFEACGDLPKRMAAFARPVLTALAIEIVAPTR
jgi:hypothetical protein